MGAILKTLGGYKDFGLQLIVRMARILRHLHPET